MRIIEYEFKDVGEPNWTINKILFSQLNLIVGLTASGKSRILNTIYNLFSLVRRTPVIIQTQQGLVQAETELKNGRWKLKLSEGKKTYTYLLMIEDKLVVKEELLEIKGTKKKKIFSRTKNKCVFNGNIQAKSDSTKTSMALLKEEKIITPLYTGFGKILRRNFYGPDLTEQLLTQKRNKQIISDLNSDVFHDYIFLCNRLYHMHLNHKEKAERIISFYKEIFPFISKVFFKKLKPAGADTGEIPYIYMKEKGRDVDISINQLSTGMIKVLIILTDLAALSNNSIYMIDEYENSLGDNAIEFLYEYLAELEDYPQLFITSHHPRLINNIPIENWYICHRRKTDIKVLTGSKLKSKFAKSHQDRFTQLLNHPFFSEEKV